ncbi:hypothetical protein HY492_01600 [Candidatus Woesearchaeota archaeon]|nr:hypothetical protein [Candidatus Woesearchaeota archaeon]
MYLLVGNGAKEGIEWMMKAVEQAREATCERRKCGSVIVLDGELISWGKNSPPGELESQRRCSCEKGNYHSKVTDKTCCVHAEQRAIINGLTWKAKKVPGSQLYFASVDERGNPLRSGKPYCTICSKMALDVGIADFRLWHQEGIGVYTTEEYNTLSFQYQG